MAHLIVGVDTGGTFTDIVVLKDGTLHVSKVLSTPDDPSRAILQGLAQLGIDTQLEVLVHGSTVATNAVLEHKGAVTGLITTAGFRDVLEIGRQTRPKLYDLRAQKTPPLVPAARRVEVTERLDERGEVLTPLDEMTLSTALATLKAAHVQALAVALLFSFTNPVHEQRVVEEARKAGFYVSASYEVLPEFREYERTSTVVLNAYVGPLIDAYLRRLEESLPAHTILRIMQSNGGSILASTARREAARTLLSGPAAGVVGASFVAKASGYARCITFDIGGTSTDVALADGSLSETTDGSIGGYPTKLPMIDIHTVGAGGGSIAWFDSGGALRVGPQSAGASPGPAAYDKGGSDVTVTDANVVLGRLLPTAFLGGTMHLSKEKAAQAMENIASRLSTTVEEAALGVVRIVNANMEAAIRVISVERGVDPRQMTLVAFGGAGPLHACELASALHIPRVLIPTFPGVLSALGMLVADTLKDYVRTIMSVAEQASDSVATTFASLEQQGREDLAKEGISPSDMQLERYLDLRYKGQSYEIVIPFEQDIAHTIERFHVVHEQRFGYNAPHQQVQVVNARLKARGKSMPFSLDALDAKNARQDEKPTYYATQRTVFTTAQSYEILDVPVYDRAALLPGMTLPGPAIITQYDTTTVLPPGWHAHIDTVRNVLAERREKEE